MSWKDRLENTVFTITTGDGKVFTPLWKSGETSKDFNTAVFDFISQPGSLIDRKQVRARKFPLLFWFTGDDNVDQAAAFDLSANDNRAWKVRHPFYGDITGQPLSIGFNDNNYNATEVQVEFWETITDSLPKTKVAIGDQIANRITQFKIISSLNYAAKVDLKPVDVSLVRDNAQKVNLTIAGVLDSVNYSEYQLAKNNMFAKIDNLILAPVDAIQAINSVLTMPALFGGSVTFRMNLLQSVFNDVKNILQLKSDRNTKAYFEANAGAVISAASQSVVNPQAGDYKTRTEVEAISAQLSDMYIEYQQLLDDAYIDITDQANSFSASNETQAQLQGTVIETIAGLNELAFNAKQERITVLDTDSNLIVLTHRYMGLDANDENIEQFRTINNIKNRSLFLIKKGRQIKYFV